MSRVIPSFEAVWVEPGRLSRGFQVHVHDISIQDPGGLHGPHIVHGGVFFGTASFRMRTIVPTKKLRRSPCRRIQGARGPEAVDVGLALPVCSEGVMEGPDIGMAITETGLEKSTGRGHLLRA
jgi:hypothetical protein